MSLPSLEDIVFIFILIVPGFFAFVIFKKVGIREIQISEFETVVWSLFASLGIYAVFGLVTGFFNLTIVKENILNPTYIAVIFGLAIGFGSGFGFIARKLFRKGFRAGDCWDACVKAAADKGSWVLVYTSNDEEYMGDLLFGGVSETPKEIVIGHPTLILRDENQNVKNQFQIGDVMFFNENDIRRIAYLKEIFKA